MEMSIIPNAQITSSSYKDESSLPVHGRLNGVGAWSPRKSLVGFGISEEFLQVDLGKEKLVGGIEMQGHPNRLHWVCKIKTILSLKHSLMMIIMMLRPGDYVQHQAQSRCQSVATRTRSCNSEAESFRRKRRQRIDQGGSL